MGLNHSVIDIPFGTIDQAPPQHQGPMGRLTDGRNIIAKHFIGADPGRDTANSGPRILIEPRNGFLSYPIDAGSPVTGSPVTVPWSNPGLLATLNRQLLSVANDVPRVRNSADWTGYSTKRVITNQLRSDVFHTSNHTIQAPSTAWCDGVTFEAWVETSENNGVPKTDVCVGFRDDTGAWIIAPRTLYISSAGVDQEILMARVRSDGTRFWMAANVIAGIDPIPVIRIYAFSTGGVQLATVDIAQNSAQPSTGYWDIIVSGEDELTLAQPGDVPDGTTDVNVQFSTCTLDGATIDVTSNIDSGTLCSGPVAWMTNDTGDGFLYLSTFMAADGVFTYQVEDRVNTHQYAHGITEDEPDSIIGYIADSGTPDEPYTFVAVSMPSFTSPSAGPANDPGLRWMETWRTDWDDNSIRQRQNNSVCAVTRAFKWHDEYYAITYYQSGSGLAITQQSDTVTWTAGDFMIGAGTQPIDVQTGDVTHGSPQSLTGSSVTIQAVQVSLPFATTPINGAGTADKVEYATSLGFRGFPDGQPCLKWTFQDMTGSIGTTGGRLVIAGQTGRPSVNGTWEIINVGSGPTTIFYTSNVNTAGGQVVAGNMDTTGTSTIVSLTRYEIPELADVYSNATIGFIVAGSMVVTGQAVSANNGTKTILRGELSTINGGRVTVVVVTGSEVSSGTGFNAVVSPQFPNLWSFTNGFANDAQHDKGVDHFLTVGDDPFQAGSNTVRYNNAGNYLITNDAFPVNTFTDGTAIVAQYMVPPLPEIAVTLGDISQAYRFFFDSLTVDYRYLGALMSVSNSNYPTNNTVYRITQLNDDGSFYAFPVDGSTNQRSEEFASDISVTIFFTNNINPVFQPCWFMTPLETQVNQAHVGRFEYMSAYADWRFEADEDLPPNMFLTGVSDVVQTNDGIRFVLPYRAQSITASTPLVTGAGQVVPAATTIQQSTVGLKQFDLINDLGTASVQGNELLLPGPMTQRFTASGFTEDGVNVCPEAPFIVIQEETSDELHLTPKTTYIYNVVFELTDENGNRIYSIPSPSLSVTMTGANNSVTIGGRNVQALNSAGLPISNHYGLTNHTLVGISIYRTSLRGGFPTVQRFKITNDLLLNGIEPISNNNNSGFDFSENEFTWYYIDRNPDTNILTGEVLYTDKSYLPRFPAPAHSISCNWKNRAWVIGYDNAVWMSGELTEGDSPWFFPGFRYTFQARPTQIQPNEEYLIVFLEDRTVWYIPAPSAFPDARGQNGSLPTPVQTKITNSCTGHAVAMRNGVAYSSTAGGVWFITRDLRNLWLSQPLIDSMDPALTEVISMTVDEDQRLHVVTQGIGGSSWFVYDQVIGCWYHWILPTSSIALVATCDGKVNFQNDAYVARYVPGTYQDNLNESTTGIAPDIFVSDLSFANVRGLKHVWEFQLTGEYLGPHNVDIVLSYPMENEDTVSTTYETFTPDASKPYVLPFNPDPESASTFDVRITVNFDGIEDPGASAAWEMLSAEVGTDPKAGINKMIQRIVKSS